MFADTIIDAVQTGSKQFVNTVFVNHKEVAAALNDLTEKQGSYVKSSIKTSTDTMTKLYSEATKAAQEFSKTAQEYTKFDFSKFTPAK